MQPHSIYTPHWRARERSQEKKTHKNTKKDVYWHVQWVEWRSKTWRAINQWMCSVCADCRYNFSCCLFFPLSFLTLTVSYALLFAVFECVCQFGSWSHRNTHSTHTHMYIFINIKSTTAAALFERGSAETWLVGIPCFMRLSILKSGCIYV